MTDRKKTDPPETRVLIVRYPTAVVFTDRAVEEDGDYKPLAYLYYRDMRLEIPSDCPASLQPYIVAKAKQIIAGGRFKCAGVGAESVDLYWCFDANYEQKQVTRGLKAYTCRLPDYVRTGNDDEDYVTVVASNEDAARRSAAAARNANTHLEVEDPGDIAIVGIVPVGYSEPATSDDRFSIPSVHAEDIWKAFAALVDSMGCGAYSDGQILVRKEHVDRLAELITSDWHSEAR